MIPILYEANETAFTTQGLGALADAVSVSVSRVINGKDELTMVYPSTGARYADILNDRIIYAVPEYKKAAQPYQIYKITKPLNGMVTVYARHVGSQRPGYIPVTPFSAGSLTETLNSLPNHLAESSPFTFWTNKTVTANFKLSRPASLGKVLGGMDGSILDVYGGEYEFDGYTIKLWQRRGTDSGVELRYAKNITDIEQSEDFASIITGVVPYWEGMDGTVVSLPEVVVEGQYADTYSFRRTIVKDFTESFEEEPTVADLRAAAVSYVSQSNIGVPEINLKVSFEHLAQYSGYENLQLLEKLNLGDTVRIFYEPLNVSATARIAKTTFDCLNEKYNSVQIGSVRSDLEQIMHTVSTNAAQIKQTLQQNIPSALAEAVENATDLITGANGGYVVLDRDANGKPFQILIMDTDDKATATNVLRLNQNGIGFSTSGYSGPFSTAWTIDSNFVADFITTGTLNAALAKIGVLADAAGKNSWNMVTGAFSITDGSINITTNSNTYDVIAFQNNEWHNAFSPLEYRIWNTDLQKAIIMQAGVQYFYDNYIENVSNTKRLAVWQDGIWSYDSNGQPRIKIGSAEIALLDSADVRRATMDELAIWQYDASGTQRQAITGTGKLQQYDANGKLRTYIEYGDIHLYNASEVERQHLNSQGELEQFDTSSVRRTYLGWGDLYLYDSSAKARSHLDSTGNLYLNDTSGTTRTKLKLMTESSWYQGRVGAALVNSKSPSASAYIPIVSNKAYSSDWSMGSLNNDLYFVNTTDTAYNAGQNRYLWYKLDYADTSGAAQTYSILTTKNTTDRVIEEGTTSGWVYRKWSSGVYECWKRFEISMALNSGWGAWFYGTVPRQSYPVTFTAAPREIAHYTGGSGWAVLCGGAALQSTTQTAQYYLVRPTSAGTGTYYFEFYVRGTV